MTRWWPVLAFAVVLVAAPPSHAQMPAPAAPAPALRVVVNDAEVSLPAPPEMRSGVLVAPLEPLVQAFGGTAAWDPATRTLTVTGVSGRTLRLVAGQTRVTSPDGAWDLPAPPTVRGDVVWGPAAAVLWGLGAYVKVDDAAGVLEAVSQVTGVAWRRDGGALAVAITATGPVRATGHLLRNPDRLAVDLASAVIRLPSQDEAVGAGGVLRVRSAQFHVRPYVTRVVLDLDHPMPFTIAAAPGAVTVALGGSPAGAQPSAAPAAASNTPSPDGTSAGSPATPVPRPAGAAPAGGSAAQGPDTPAVPVAIAVPPSAGGPVAPEPVALPPLPEFVDGPGAFHVRGAAYDERGGAGQVTIRASRPLVYTVHEFVYPDRLAIDIAGGVFPPRRQDLEVGTGTVRNVIVSQFRLRPNVVRVLIHLQHKAAYTVVPADGGRSLVVAFPAAGPRVAREPAVIIDPGHGGADSGALGPGGLREADVTLSIGRLVGEALAREGVRAVLTRTDDTTVPLEDRPDLAQRNGGVAFVSIHANASRDPEAAGTETYYRTPESQALAALVQGEVVQALGEPDRGVRTADFYVLVNTPMPSVLVEVAFISNPAEEALLRDPAVQRRVAEAIARAVVTFLAAERQAAAP
jgi:N-acetylmuramoyl-L-alanine amidase